MRKVSNDNAGTCVSANAFFTIIALVENKTAPIKATMKPVKRIVFFDDCIIKNLKMIRRSLPFRGGLVGLYILTLKSLNASFKLVLRSVLGLR